MNNFKLHMNTKLVVGPGVFKSLGKEAIKHGKKTMLVTGRSSARKLGYLDQAVGYLEKAGMEVEVFDRIEPNPRHTTCNDAAEICREKNIDVIIALGGGSAMDAAKAIAASAFSGLSCWDHCFHLKGMTKVTGGMPIITIPTTAATGSEANTAGVITNWDTNEKCPLFSPFLLPKTAICDPELHTSVSKESTADGAVDILSHGFESYFNGADDCSVQDRITEGLFNTVFEWGPVAFKEGGNVRARRELMYASTLMLNGLANSGRDGFWPIHAIEHAISGHYDIAHGRGLAIVIPRYLRFIEDLVPHRLAQFGRNCFGLKGSEDSVVADQAIDRLVKWFDVIGENQTLKDVGIGNDKFEAMAEDIIRNYGNGEYFENIKKLDKEAIVKLFENCQVPN